MRTLAVIGGRRVYHFLPERPAEALAQSLRAWHGARMEQQNGKASRAGGVIIAFTVMAGALIGARLGQPSLGTVIGIAMGAAIALGLFIHDRRHH